MPNDDALDRRANNLYDAAMSAQRAALQANDDGRYADEAKHWQLYAALMLELEQVYAAIRERNHELYGKVSTTPRVQRITTHEQKMRKSEAERMEAIKAILKRDGEVRTGAIVDELDCSRSATNTMLKVLAIWGVAEKSIRGVWRLVEDESA